MTTEPRQEAERLVWEYRQLCESDVPLPYDEDGRNPLENGLVDALAAAIEVDRAAGVPRDVEQAERKVEVDRDAWGGLREALSALREDET